MIIDSYWNIVFDFRLSSLSVLEPFSSNFINIQFFMDYWTRLFTLAFVWFLIFYESITYILMYGSVMLQQNMTMFILVVPLFIVIVSLICITYYKAIVTGPGHPPVDLNDQYDNWPHIKEKAKEIQELRKEIKEKGLNKAEKIDEIEILRNVSWCMKCQKVKEVRVHHCKVCQKCILRMDHHCPWIGNCVGRNNHKYFIQFLFYAPLGLAVVAIHIGLDYLFGQSIASQYDQTYQLNIKWCGMTSGCLALTIGFLFVTQIRSLAINLTTIETYVKGIEQIKPWVKNSFSENVQEIFGKSNWFLPTKPFGDQPNLFDSIDL